MTVNKQDELDKLKKKMLSDTGLPLRQGTRNLVFGEGSPDSKMMFIGEGPGYWEDVKGRPFVGNAGMLLDQLLQSIKVAREDVFITNVVNFRPPENRDPLPIEIKAFQPYLDKMIEIINPKLVVTLGRFSMAKFLPGNIISRVHGKLFEIEWQGKSKAIVPMYHPAAALRNPEVKRQIAADFAKLPEILESLGKVKIEQMQLT